MAKSLKLTVVEDANGATTVNKVEASIADVLTTALSQDTVVTGMLGLTQRGLLFAGGMAVNNYMKQGKFNFIS